MSYLSALQISMAGSAQVSHELSLAHPICAARNQAGFILAHVCSLEVSPPTMKQEGSSVLRLTLWNRLHDQSS